MVHESWLDDRREFDTKTLPMLKEHGMDIGRDAQEGCTISQAVIKYYSMLRRSFDPVTHLFLKEQLNLWIKK